MSDKPRLRQLKAKALKDFLRGVQRPEVDLVFLLQDLEDPVNVGAAFRIADGCEASEIILTGKTPTPPDSTIAGVGRGAHRRIPWRYVEHADEALVELKGMGYMACAIEVAEGAVPYYSLKYPDRVCLVVGHEYHGVTTRTLSVCDNAVYIPMYGKIKSLNVHVALAVVAFHVLHQQLICG
ncbi:tRNA/rRNA methyltransferase (SpoU) [Thermobaculum terrenum ATCC BAA-798]|uniref:tRNA/rRNA methyltransferase (SpoU) n=1 Tax=Thermobaculum terrenum (strain ATCC BAA-798 / CCMEE 7001 / YNP1) TaxID=525904 RepID=D1CEQ6_THET1|nr:RNA methyltransferase [Thermobaculum terrenum]ACZ41412.1 tRNA/rRNA methyltransferase (SpoU) [Thermobaculum terrenum ATCC BAA-798]